MDNQQPIELQFSFNPNIQPIYADQISSIGIEGNIVKLVFANRFENTLNHSATIAMPLGALLMLNEMLNHEDFRKNLIQNPN